MNGMKCRSCGLFNALSDSSCERCAAPLAEGLPVALPGADAGGAVSRVHRWDAAALAKALIAGAAAECAAAAPLAYYGMGHAGPNGGVLGVLSFLINLPGFLFLVELESISPARRSWAGDMAVVFLLQTALLGYALFVYFRLRSLRRGVTGGRGRGFTMGRTAPPALLVALAFAACLSLIVKLAESNEGRAAEGGCAVTVVSRAESPDGKYVATVSRSSCGPAGSESLHTYGVVKEVPAHFWSERSGGRTLADMSGFRPLGVRWDGPRRLVVVTPDLKEVDPERKGIAQDTFWRDVDIHYE